MFTTLSTQGTGKQRQPPLIKQLKQTARISIVMHAHWSVSIAFLSLPVFGTAKAFLTKDKATESRAPPEVDPKAP